MIQINITITDTPLPDGRFYVRIEAMPDNVGSVTDYERRARNAIMEAITITGKYLATDPGTTGAFIAEVPVSQRQKKGDKSEPQERNTGGS